jgi:predicted permease
MKFLSNWFRRDRIERDIDDELSFHVEAHARDLVSEGVPPEEARRRALATFGGIAPIKELTREARGGRWLEDLLSDLRYAVRSFRHQPGVAGVAILTLTLGIGANTAIFSMVNGLLLRPLPVREPGRLVLFSDSVSEGTRSGTPAPSGRWDLFSSESYEYLRSQSLPLQIGAFASGEQTVALRLPGQSTQDVRAQAHLVSGNYFDVIGAAPALGRMLSNDDDRSSAVPVAVASNLFWRQRLGSDPAAIGRTITINGTAFGIVGVMPPEFFGVRVRRSPDLWVPLVHQPQVQLRPALAARPEHSWLSLFGRLGPSDTIAGAQAVTTSALRQFLTASAGAQPSDNNRERVASVRVQLVPGARGISVTRNQNRDLLVLLLSAVGVILLIACSNVGTLFLARAVARQREIAVRRALGASRGRLIRQWLTESVLLAGLGAVGGGIVARFAAPPLFATFVAASSPAKATIDGVVLAFTTGAALLSSLIFGLAPALRAGRVDPLVTLRAAGPSSSSRHRAGATDPFVVAQIARSMTLVVGAALLVRTLINLERAPLGFDQERILLASLSVRIPGAVGANPHATDARPEVLDLWSRVYDLIRALPGVESATLARYSPFSGSTSSRSLEIEGYVPIQGERVDAETIAVGANDPQTMGMPVIAGRAISPDDRPSTPRVVVVNASFARKYFAGGNAVGRRLQISRGGLHEIVGVVEDARFHSVRDTPPPTVFLALLQDSYLSSTCAVQLRTTGNADIMTETVRRAIASVDGRVEVGRVQSLRSQVLATFAPERTAAGFFVGFAVLALFVAAVGLYGTVSYGLERRTSEIGLRIALGAARRDVVWMVARASLIRLASGLLVGALLARAAGSLVSAQLFGVAPNDALSQLVAAAILSIVVALATVRPLARAMRIDPMIALRTE